MKSSRSSAKQRAMAASTILPAAMRRLALSVALAKPLSITAEEVPSRVAIVMSGGTEGGLSPHFLVFAVRDPGTARSGIKSLAIGAVSTPVLRPEQIGRMPQVE